MFADGQHDAVSAVPHGFDPVAKVVVAIVGKIFSCEYFALKFKVSDEGEGLHVLVIFQEDVMLDFHRFVEIEKMSSLVDIIPSYSIFYTSAPIYYHPSLLGNSLCTITTTNRCSWTKGQRKRVNYL